MLPGSWALSTVFAAASWERGVTLNTIHTTLVCKTVLCPTVADSRAFQCLNRVVRLSLLQSFASLLGSLLGSQLIPTFAGSAHEVVPKYPRRTLYGLFAAMLLFVPAFALAIHFGTPAELIPLVFLLFLYGG